MSSFLRNDLEQRSNLRACPAPMRRPRGSLLPAGGDIKNRIHNIDGRVMRQLSYRPRCLRPTHLLEHDSQTQIRTISFVFEEEECGNGKTPQPGNILNS